MHKRYEWYESGMRAERERNESGMRDYADRRLQVLGGRAHVGRGKERGHELRVDGACVTY